MPCAVCPATATSNLYNRLNIYHRCIVKCVEAGYFESVALAFQQYYAGKADGAGAAGRAAGEHTTEVSRMGCCLQVIPFRPVEIEQYVQFAVVLNFEKAFGKFLKYFNGRHRPHYTVGLIGFSLVEFISDVTDYCNIEIHCERFTIISYPR